MKYKVSVIKKIAFLVMTMALAVAMVACSGAAGTPGPAGPAGPAGQDAPTPDPTPPTDPTDPPEPTGPPNAAPVATMIPNVYLALEGTGKMTSASVDPGMYITDADSVLRFGVSSSDKMVATVKETDGMLTITAIKAGSATITVMAHDGSNDPVPAEIMVTVVKTNVAPTTNGLSGSDKKKIEMPLFIADGAKPFTVTIVSRAGAADPVVDSIVSYAIVIGKEDAKKAGFDADSTDDMVSVTVVKKGTGNKYVIEVKPKAAAKGMQPVMIYPKDMFGAMVSKPWMFTAMFNKPPIVVTGILGSNDTGPLKRAAVAATDPPAALTGDTSHLIDLSEYFKDLQTVAPTLPQNDTNHTALLLTKAGDTVCDVSPSTSSLALVLPLNSFGGQEFDSSIATVISKDHIAMGDEATTHVLIDSRYSSLGDDMIISTADPLKPANTDKKATGSGTISIMITCTDKDASAVVTGEVVVR